MKREYISINITPTSIHVIEKVYGEITSGTGEMPVDKVISYEYTVIDGQLVLTFVEETLD